MQKAQLLVVDKEVQFQYYNTALSIVVNIFLRLIIFCVVRI